jgi:hypothetical protein
MAIKKDQSAESGFEYSQHFTRYLLSLEDATAAEEKSVTARFGVMEDKIREIEGKGLLPKRKRCTP